MNDRYFRPDIPSISRIACGGLLSCFRVSSNTFFANLPIGEAEKSPDKQIAGKQSAAMKR
jgi:hypothetical protein